MRNPRAVAAAALLVVLPTAAWPEIDLAAVAACIDRPRTEGGVAVDCVAEAMTTCRVIPPEAPALASQCYRTARAEWSQGITSRMAGLRSSAPETIAAIAAIEVKYDLLSGLMQCDRMRDLALLGDAPEETIQREADRCAADAAGRAYVRLIWRARDLP